MKYLKYLKYSIVSLVVLVVGAVVVVSVAVFFYLYGGWARNRELAKIQHVVLERLDSHGADARLREYVKAQYYEAVMRTGRLSTAGYYRDYGPVDASLIGPVLLYKGGAGVDDVYREFLIKGGLKERK